jgi:hypothetical protein
MNKDGFILMEVIVSIMLLSIVSIALLKIDSNQNKLYQIASNKLEFVKYSSIVLDRKSTRLHNKKINLYSMIKTQYNIKNKLLIKSLKNSDIEYQQKYKNLINLDDIKLLIDEIQLRDKMGTSKYMTIKM